MAALQEVKKDGFEAAVLKSEKPVLVLFSSEWCPACKRLGPLMEELAGEIADRATVLHVDVSNDAELASTYGVMSIPTVIAFQGGEAGKRSVGYVPKDELLALLS